MLLLRIKRRPICERLETFEALQEDRQTLWRDPFPCDIFRSVTFERIIGIISVSNSPVWPRTLSAL